MHVLAGLVFGIVAGLRVMTGEAVFYGLRGGVLGIVFPIAAVGEYIGDALPWVPARITTGPFLLRCASGAFMGWMVAGVPGVVAGVIGSLIGTFGGYQMRIWLIAKIGAIPAALLEDVLAIALAFAAIAAIQA